MRKQSISSRSSTTKVLLLSIVIVATVLFNLETKQLFAYLSDIQPHRSTSAAVQGKVWLDENKNGLYDDTTESGVPNVLIKLYSSASTSRKILSDAQGNFEFSGLDSGNYSLEFINPLDYKFVEQSTDSDVNPETGEVLNLSITEGGTGSTDVKAGLIKQEIQTPTPIALESFELSLGVQNGQNGVHLEWKTTSEIETRGFYLLRSTTGAYGDAVKISPFIASEGGPDQDGDVDGQEGKVKVYLPIVKM